MRHPIAKGEYGVTVEIPDGAPERFPNGSCSHYLWIGDKAGNCITTIAERTELRKIRNNIDKILQAKPRANSREAKE